MERIDKLFRMALPSSHNLKEKLVNDKKLMLCGVTIAAALVEKYRRHKVRRIPVLPRRRRK